MHEVARTAREQMPPHTAFRDEDEVVLAANREFLAGLEDTLVKAFYDTLFAHPPTAEVFIEGERPNREKTLSDWWQRTVEGPHDDDYFAWMAMVGLVHVIRGVSNPMMLGMSDFVSRAVEELARGALTHDDVAALSEAYRRLTATVSSVITYGYDMAIEKALYDVAGMPVELLHRLRNQEISRELSTAREQLGRKRFE